MNATSDMNMFSNPNIASYATTPNPTHFSSEFTPNHMNHQGNPASFMNLISSTMTPVKRNVIPHHERRFVCTYPDCGKRFNRKFTLKEHTKTHTGVKPYKCPYEGCTSRFSTSGNLSRHKYTHTGERPFACTIGDCTKRFCTREKLARHTKTHSGLRPFVCKVEGCNKRFSTSGNLGRHVKTHKNNSIANFSSMRMTLNPPVSVPQHSSISSQRPTGLFPSTSSTSPSTILSSISSITPRQFTTNSTSNTSTISTGTTPVGRSVFNEEIEQDILSALKSPRSLIPPSPIGSSPKWTLLAKMTPTHMNNIVNSLKSEKSPSQNPSTYGDNIWSSTLNRIRSDDLLRSPSVSRSSLGLPSPSFEALRTSLSESYTEMNQTEDTTTHKPSLARSVSDSIASKRLRKDITGGCLSPFSNARPSLGIRDSRALSDIDKRQFGDLKKDTEFILKYDSLHSSPAEFSKVKHSPSMSDMEPLPMMYNNKLGQSLLPPVSPMLNGFALNNSVNSFPNTRQVLGKSA